VIDESNSEKPITLADYIPPEPKPVSEQRRQPSKKDRERLDDLDRSIRKEASKPKRKSKKKPSFWTMVFWVVMIVVIANIVD